MPSILDIAPPEIAAREFDIRGTKLKISGVPAIDWATLYARYPHLRQVLVGRLAEADVPMTKRFRAQAAMIAAGLGKLGDPKVERAVMANLTMEEQIELASEVLKISQPGEYLVPLLEAEDVEGEGD